LISSSKQYVDDLVGGLTFQNQSISTFCEIRFGLGVCDGGFRVERPDFRIQGLGLTVQGSGFRVQGSGFRVQGSGFRVLGSGVKAQGSGFRVPGMGMSGNTTP
jgi:hypothetical protein